jgi:hypothetical protein
MAGRQTPATRAADKAGITYTLHEYDHDPRADSYAGEAAEVLGLDPRRVFKTLVVTTGGPDELVVAIVPAADQLDLKAVGKRAAMADTGRAERSRATSRAASARWASASGYRRSWTPARRSSPPSSSRPDGGGWRSSWRQETSRS